jgi:uncharacterized protein (TIGR02996 family)
VTIGETASLETVFLRDIHASPDDDTPRLVFADWLEDHGDPDRAELIRLQCRLAAGQASSAAEARVTELLALHQRRWLGKLWAPGLRWQFRRGLVEGLEHSGLFRTIDTYHWLRFYGDGTVLSVTTTTTTPREVLRWFNKDHEAPSRGTYVLTWLPGDLAIRFSATSSYGTVDFEGTMVSAGTMVLNSHSHINDYRGRNEYHWVDAAGRRRRKAEG